MLLSSPGKDAGLMPTKLYGSGPPFGLTKRAKSMSARHPLSGRWCRTGDVTSSPFARLMGTSRSTYSTSTQPPDDATRAASFAGRATRPDWVIQTSYFAPSAIGI